MTSFVHTRGLPGEVIGRPRIGVAKHHYPARGELSRQSRRNFTDNCSSVGEVSDILLRHIPRDVARPQPATQFESAVTYPGTQNSVESMRRAPDGIVNGRIDTHIERNAIERPCGLLDDERGRVLDSCRFTGIRGHKNVRTSYMPISFNRGDVVDRLCKGGGCLP
jgi:hypothetical protein